MAMAIDTRQPQQHFSAMGYDPMRYQQPAQPHFTNPWGSAPPPQNQMYQTSMPHSTLNDYKLQTSVTAPYSSSQLSAPSLAADMSPRPYGAAYSNASPASVTSYAPTSAGAYQTSYAYQQADRRTSHPLQNASEAERQNYSDAVDASRGMIAMSQSDITPRNIYGNQNSSRSSMESYGFPSAHSSHSSISSASAFPTYYNSSVSEASTGDYGSASESIDVPSSRQLPRPNGLVMGGAMPPAPQSMMGSFSSKVSSSSQKKHKCKVCEKRFTRPSSLQTHMYSHTGEKPFACDVEGCGRHFSVVSNLRRHRKVHKGEGRDHSSPDDMDDE